MCYYVYTSMKVNFLSFLYQILTEYLVMYDVKVVEYS